ncbi:MAG: hypothetical protein GX446_17355 [Chthonomonadales bacterium]|nr:hypothetical protein [Chthonomonadales bacterium]
MNARDWVELALAVLLTLNLIVLGGAVAVGLRRVAALSTRLEAAVGDIQRQSVTALQDTHAALTRLAELSASLEQLVKHDVSPTMQVARSALTHVDTTLQGVADATSTVRRIAAGAEALTTPSAISEAAGKLISSSGGRVAMISGIALAVLKTVSAARRGKPKVDQ